MKRKSRIIVAVLLLALSIAGWWGYRKYQERRAVEALLKFLFTPNEKPSWRRYLPATAAEVREWAWADGFLPDYGYLLKARITETEFKQFVSQLGLTPHTPDRKYSEESHWLSWSALPGFDGDWWDVSSSLDSTYVSEGNDTWIFAKYESGCLYFQSLNH